MVQITARKTADENVSSLSVCIKNRILGINTYVSLKLKIKTKEWSNEVQLPRHPTDQRPVPELRGMSYAELSDRLVAIKKELSSAEDCGALTVDYAKTVIMQIINKEFVKELQEVASRQEQETKKQQRITLMEWIEEFIRQCEAGERLKRKSTNVITPGTIKSYKGTKAQLEAYQKTRHRVIDFDDVTIDFYDDWRRFFLEKKNKKGVSTPYSPNTIGKHVKNLKIFLFAAKDMKLTTTTDFESSRFVAESQDVENVYLTEERIQELYETDFEDGKTIERLMALAPDDDERDVMKDQLTRRTPKLLNEAKDIFVVGCLTGQRVSDYKRINEEMYRELSDGNEYIYLQQAKTGKWIYIPLDLRVRVILQKYGGKLPHIYDQDLNERIKVVGRMMGWRENAGITELHGMMQVPTSKKFYECIKTHTARRSFATNAYKRKISLSSIMVITGHSSERMLRKYLKLDNEERAILAAAEFEKAKEVKLKAVE
ncbi:MAG: phage integrase SAM-like domain-containing protein [Prevotella sp.]|nr:phage integrase SAM-like domain-containing protein [Prevotella sp.]